MNLTHNPTTAKAQEAESETPPPIQLSKSTADHHTPKSLSFTNGVLKRHHQPNTPAVVLPVIYKECQKNHAASLGGHALDGCGEFMPSPTSTPTDPTSLKCAACGCHRNFHRRDPEEPSLYLDFPHHHYHHPPPPPSVTARERSPNSSSPSPPPLSSSYYTSAPHMLLALSSRPSDNHQVVNNNNHQVAEATTLTTPTTVSPNGRKRFRTRFSQGQKEKMFAFAERLGWKMQKRDEVLVEEFCNEVGVGKSVLKVWMHNNKHSSGKRENANNNITSPHVGTTNGSSSSS